MTLVNAKMMSLVAMPPTGNDNVDGAVFRGLLLFGVALLAHALHLVG